MALFINRIFFNVFIAFLSQGGNLWIKTQAIVDHMYKLKTDFFKNLILFLQDIIVDKE